MNHNKKKINEYMKYFMILFVPIFTIVFLIDFFIYKDNINQEIDKLKLTEKANIEIVTRNLSSIKNLIRSDLMYISQNNVLNNYINGRTKTLHDFSRDMLKFSLNKKIYDQIRYIDEKGMEKVRINYNSGAPFITPKDNLQNKKNIYYFTESVKLNFGTIYISPFDLNTEKRKVEDPYKPMIRFGTPVYDENGKNKGIVILNYLGDFILDNIKKHYSSTNLGQQFLINKQSYYLLHPSKESEWGFMFEDGYSKKFKNDYPEFWEKIITRNEGQILHKNQLLSFKKLYFISTINHMSINASNKTLLEKANNLNSRISYWYLISFINEKEIMSIKTKFKNHSLINLSVSTLLLIIASMAFSVTKYNENENLSIIESKNEELIVKNIKLEKLTNELYEKNEELFINSTRDSLTGIYNKGYLLDQLSREFYNSKRHKVNLGCIIFDIDNFKKVNDVYGHLAGDYIIKSVAQSVNSIVRNEDVFGRYGGDEFLLVMAYSTFDQCINKAETIRKKIEGTVFKFNQNDIEVSLSLGVAELIDDIKTREAFIEKADQALYRAKKNGKNCVGS